MPKREGIFSVGYLAEWFKESGEESVEEVESKKMEGKQSPKRVLCDV